MKKVFNKTQLLILILLQINLVITAQTISKDNIQDQIEKGIIKSKTESSYWFDTTEKFGEIKTKKTLYNKWTRSFDKKGRMIGRIIYDDNENINSKNEYTFNDDENSRESIRYNSEGKIDQRWKSFYDENGNSIKEYDIDINNYKMDLINGAVNEVILTDIKYEYNDNGKLISDIRYNENGSVYTKEKNQYYENGIIKENHSIYFGREPNSILANAHKIKYNIKGEKIENYKYDSDGDLSNKYRYEYNSAGDLLKSYQYRSDGSVWKESKYDDKENITKEIIYFNGEIIGVILFTYEFDNNGNWIKKTKDEKMSKYGSKTSIEERIIEYY